MRNILYYLIVVFISSVYCSDNGKVVDIDDYFTQNYTSKPVLSPDGSYLTYTEYKWNEDKDGRESDIWIVSTKLGEPIRLTFDGSYKSQLQWGDDNKTIYFKSTNKRSGEKTPPYNNKSQVWRISIDNTQFIPVTKHTDGVGMFRLSFANNSIYYTTKKKDITDEWKGLKEEFSNLKYGHGVVSFSKVWSVNLSTWRESCILDNKKVITDISISPKGNYCAIITKPDGTLLSGEGWSNVEILDLRSGTSKMVTESGWRNEHPAPYGWLENLAWPVDEKSVAFTVAFDGYPAEIYIYNNEKDPYLYKVNRPDNIHISNNLYWRGNTNELCFLAEEKARRRVYSFRNLKQESKPIIKTITPGDVVVNSFSFNKNGNTMAASITKPDRQADIYTVSSSGGYKRLTNINPQIDNWIKPKISLVRWTGANGDLVEGILELPPDYNNDNPLPLVVIIHGGPTSAALYQFRYWIYGRTLLSSKGYATLSPNYRGSTGYGDKFMVDLIGNENDIDVEDILAGVDAMIEKGIADPKRLGVMGWSNGGFLTNCIITADNRFKAASSGAGVIDQVMQWGIEDTPGHVINYMTGLPWDVPKEYSLGSPLYSLNKVTTPTLIHVGEYDERVPVQHSIVLHRALNVYLGIDTELVIYPGEGHGLSKHSHRMAKLKWDIEWFEKYLR